MYQIELRSRLEYLYPLNRSTCNVLLLSRLFLSVIDLPYFKKKIPTTKIISFCRLFFNYQRKGKIGFNVECLDVRLKDLRASWRTGSH